MSRIKIIINKFDDDLPQPKKPMILTWDFVVVGLNSESLTRYYQWFSHVFYDDNEAFVIGYTPLHKGINVTIMNTSEKLEL